MRNTFVTVLGQLAENDANISLITADLGYNVLTSFAEQYPNRFYNAGISEQNMTAVAAGMALTGKIVYTYSIGNFSTVRCLEQIRNDICYHNANVKIVIVGGGFAYGQLGMSHHATEDIAALRALPQMRVFVPADPKETSAVTKHVNATDGPCYIRLAKGGEKTLHTKDALDITRPIECVQGEQIAVFAAGPILEEALNAAEEVQKQGVHIGVYSVPCIKPMDRVTILRLLNKYQYIITLEEHTVIGGLGSVIAEFIAEEEGCNTRLYRLGLQDCYTSIVGDQKFLREYYHMSAKNIVEIVEKITRSNAQ